MPARDGLAPAPQAAGAPSPGGRSGPGAAGLLARIAFALKPASWPKLLVPMLLGQALGIASSGRLSPGGLLAGGLFTLLDLGFIVLLNDWGDAPVDRLKRAMFPGSSRKTIPDGVLPSRALLVAGVACGGAALAVMGIAERGLDRPGLALWAGVSLALFVAYTLPPLRLNYRGGGELLEGLGVGVLLPWLNAYVQGGELASRVHVPLVGFFLLSLASGVASGLSDERSDRAGGKRTFTTQFGNAASRRATQALVVAGAVVWMGCAAWAPSRAFGACMVLAAGVALAAWPALRRASGPAVTDAFDAQRTFKGALHRAIWGSALVLAAGLCLMVLAGPHSNP